MVRINEGGSEEVHIGKNWWVGEDQDGDLVFYNLKQNKIIKAIDVLTGDTDIKGRELQSGTTALTSIAASQLEDGTIKEVVPVHIPDSEQAGLAADSTGVKYTSDFVQQLNPQNLNSATLRASWTASQTDSVTAIEVYDEAAGSVLGSISGNTGTDTEGSISGFTAGNSVVVRANVTTASATSGATTDVVYIVLELTYAVS